MAHNGNLTNAGELRERLEERGSIFQSNSDTEVIVHLIATALHSSFESRVAAALSGVQGAFSLLFLTPSSLIAVRDPRGFRPLCLGELSVGHNRSAYLVASEPTSFDLIGARFVRDVEPGEMIAISGEGMTSRFHFGHEEARLCVFEYIYFARPDSVLNGIEVYGARKALGRKLAEEQPADADVVIALPDSGVHSAMGYAEAAGLPFEMGLIRSRYVGRTFIEPQQTIRHFGVRLKFNPVAGRLKGKRVVVVDDSIVRGTTIQKIVTMLRGVGATEVHVRISSPPVLWPCYYGIDTPTRKELVASTHSEAEIGRHVGATSLGYLTLPGTLDAIRSEGQCDHFCDACFSGNYSVPYDSLIPPRRLRVVSQ